MPPLYRFMQDPDCVFSESFSDLNYLRDNYTVAGNPTPVDTAYGKGLSLDGTDDKIVFGNVPGTLKTFLMFVQLASTTEQIADFDSGTNYLSASAGTLSVASCADEVLYVGASQTATIAAGSMVLAGFTSSTGITVSNLQIGTDNTSFGEIIVAKMILSGREWSATEISNIAFNRSF